MPWFLVALFAVPILATLWAVGFGVMAVREKRVFWRMLSGLLTLIGTVFAAAGWYLLGTFLLGDGIALVYWDPPVARVCLLSMGILALLVGARGLRARLKGRL